MDKWEVMAGNFGAFFFIGQRWQYIIDKELAKYNLTTKQWMMLAVIDKAFDCPPAIQEVAEKMSTTHQNVKQIAVNLEKRGFISIERCNQDRRVLRLKTTGLNERFWRERNDSSMELVSEFFAGLSEAEMQTLQGLLKKTSARADELYERAQNIQ